MSGASPDATRGTRPVQSGPRIGAHMSIAGGLIRAVERAEISGCETFQIFTKSSNQWRARPLAAVEVDAFRTRLDASGLSPVVAHASYLINVASPDASLRRRSVTALEEELARVETLGLDGLVLHPGAHTTSTEADGLARIAEAVGRALERASGRTRLLLEHTAGQGTVLGHRFEHLRRIIDGAGGPPRLGICLDTCHLVAAGYDIISDAGYEQVFNELDAVIGLDRLAVFHLNDSKAPLGSRVDRHEHIGHGRIGREPFGRLLRDDRFRTLPMILETAKCRGSSAAVEADPRDLENLAVLRTLRERPPPRT